MSEPAASPPGEPGPAVEPLAPVDAVPARPQRDLRRLLRRFGPAAVVIAVVVFASPVADRWPSSQTVEIALDAPTEVTRVRLEVAPRGETDPVFTATWNFDRGTAPGRIQAQMATPDGPYDAEIAIVRADAPAQSETKHVDLDGNRVTLFPR